MNKITSILIFAIVLNASAFSQPNCNALSTGFIPINDLGNKTFTNEWKAVWTGGLYPNGSNSIPSQHKLNGLQKATEIQCVDKNGNPDPTNGKIVWLSIGMSNCTQETQQFLPQANSFAGKNPRLILVDGAQGGQTAQVISSPWNSGYSNFWTTVGTRLSNTGVSANQVQVIWFKEANQAGSTPIQAHYDSLVVQIKRSMNEIKTRFPNVKMCYLASRISGRYATSTLNPEPYSYYTGWAVKKVIEDQINGDKQLAYSGLATKSPWLAWGIYMWSDGETPQLTNPNIFFACPSDYQNDGTHPSTEGAKKVGELLLNFFSTDSTCTPWFLGTGCNINTGIKDIENEYLVSIFPNPFSTQTTLKITNKNNNLNLSIYNCYGKIIKQIKTNSAESITLSRESLPSGVYYIRLTNDREIISIKKIMITD